MTHPLRRRLLGAWSLLGLLVACATPAAASIDNKGTEFLLGFMPNLLTPLGIEVHLTADVATQVTVEYPVNSPTFQTTVAVNPGQIAIVTLPNEAAQSWNVGSVDNNAVHLTAPKEFVAYMINRAPATSDAGLALPVDALNTEYIAITYEGVETGFNGEFVVVAPFDNTMVTITPTKALVGGQYAAHQPFTITLNRGEGFLAQSADIPADLTGSIISANRPVHVSNGNLCTNVPVGTGACDHVFEVAQPVQSWGTHALVANLPQRPAGTVYRVIASQDGTTVNEDGGAIGTIDRGHFIEVGPTPGDHSFDADKPIFVEQYMTGEDSPGASGGDPSMGNMIPPEQYLNHYTFSTVGGGQFAQHFLSVIVKTDDVPNFRLDGQPVTATFDPIGTSGYSATVLDLAEGTHTTSSSQGHGITVEGYGSFDSYEYPGGALFEFINPVGDANPPICHLDLFPDANPPHGDGSATDNRPTEDVNHNGILDPGEDLNGNGQIDTDTGIFSITLEGDTNLTLTTSPFVPGDPMATFHVEPTDPSLPASGTVVVSDGAGNKCMEQVQFEGNQNCELGEGTPCDDHNPCTTNDTCDDANHCAGTPVVCPQSDACHGAGECDPETGLCSNPLVVMCPPTDACHLGVCDPDSGECSNPAAPDGTPCGDGNACNGAETCQGGTCTPGTPLVCTASDACHVAGTCDPTTGCGNPPAPDGTPCADGNVCNGQEICEAGRCAAPTRAAALACENASLVAFVTEFNDNAVALIPSGASSVAGTAGVGTAPWGVAVRPFTNEVYTTNRQGSTVSILDSVTRAVTGTITVGATPLGVVTNAAGTRAWVANYDANTVSVIDTASRTVIATIPVGHGPAGLALGPGGARLYVSDYAGGTVSVVDTASNAVVALVTVGTQPLELGVDASKNRLYVANYGSNTVTVVGTLSNTVLTTVPVGSKPFGVAIDAGASRAYVTNASSDDVSVLDTGLNVVLGSIPVGRAPFGIGLDRTGGRAFVANAGGNTVSVVDTGSRTVTATVPVGNLPIAFGDFLGVIASHCGSAGLGTCDDGDPFTLDTCSPNTGCQHVDRGQGDLAAGLAALADEIRSSNLADLGGSKAKNLLQQLVNGALSQLGTPRAVAADLLTPLDHPSPRVTGVARRRLKRIARQLRLFLRAVEKGIRKRTIQRDLGWRLLDIARADQNVVRTALGVPAATPRASAAAVGRNPALPPAGVL